MMVMLVLGFWGLVTMGTSVFLSGVWDRLIPRPLEREARLYYRGVFKESGGFLIAGECQLRNVSLCTMVNANESFSNKVHFMAPNTHTSGNNL
jgi:hypothetical protein